MVSEKKDLEKRTKLKESYIPGLIIWVPIISIIITAFILFSFFIVSYNTFLDVENLSLRERLLDDGKFLIKDEVEEIVDYINFNKSNAVDWLKEELKERVDVSYSIIKSIYEQNSTNRSKSEIIEIIRVTLKNVRFFDGRGYYFIENYNLTDSNYSSLKYNISNPDDNYRDAQLFESVHNLLETDSEGFLTLDYLDDQNIEGKKLIYTKLFEPLNIIVGTGEFLDFFEEQIKNDVLLWLEKYRFGNGNYFFIFNTNGTILMHPILSALVNTNIGDIKDSTDYEFGKEYLKSSKVKTGVFVNYTWPDPDTGMETLKIGYAKLYEDWNWNIATGIYLDHIEDVIIEGQNNLSIRVKEVTLRTVLIVCVLVFIVLIITLISAKFTISLFGMYNRHIKASSLELKEFTLSLEKKVQEKTFELEKKNIELEQIATIDSLTDIYNRRYFDFILNKEWFRHMRNKREISLIMCDIDFFKQYNDTYGHQQGDECLKIVVSIVKKVCKRPTDIPVRYGGEEFAIILPQTNLHGAKKIALGLQSELSNYQIKHERSDISKFLTISFGISALNPEKGSDYSSLIKIADSALYRAKANGRNRIET
jgi:diguanylate cyclase (GGDEF)-like protein